MIWQSTILLLFYYRSELLAAHSVTVFQSSYLYLPMVTIVNHFNLQENLRIKHLSLVNFY